MTFVTVVLALLVERLVPQYRPRRRHRWFEHYCRWLAQSRAAQRLGSRPWGAPLGLLPPLLAIGWLQMLANQAGSLVAVPFGFLVLLFSLGPRELGEDVEAFLSARDHGDAQRAGRAAEALCPGPVPNTEPQRSLAVARAVLVQANRRLIGPLFWFVLFGAIGAAAYRAIQLLAQQLEDQTCPEAMKRYSDEMRHVADWAPARVTAAGYAMAGDFDGVAHAWRSFDYTPGDGPLTEAERLLSQAGLAALDTFPDDTTELTGDQSARFDAVSIPPIVEDALALVWRALVIWVSAIAAGSLIALLA